MKFRENLQVLRTQKKMSQEELALQLGISRQSVTKWENGQSFPDIENLISLSELFGVSIDRLIKENGQCQKKLFLAQELLQKDIRAFLCRAKKNTYASGENEAEASRTGSRDFLYREDELLYRDIYFGGQCFIGEEAVWNGNTPIYGMNYYGRALDDQFDVSFLKEALSLVDAENPYRGPELYKKGDFTYFCQLQGDFACFEGTEKIYCGQDTVYTCSFHGGEII